MAANPTANTVRCPTCRAEQEWSDTCRRCKSDLRLLRALAKSYLQNRRACLEHLRQGRLREALHAARRCYQINADTESRRLLALTALQGGDWATAADLVRLFPRET
jgi:hypothetical protein